MSVLKNNKRIAYNSIFLYIRMAFLMILSLYSSRILIKGLGITDFGIYNVVGGVVSMVGFISSSLSGATSRFITFELGKSDINNLKRIFRCSITIHYIIVLFIFLLAETIGLWFLMERIVIPKDRMFASLLVYQCSIITFLLSILGVPFRALIIAHEFMGAFSIISIVEGILKFSIVYLLLICNTDRLVLYAVLLLIVQIIIQVIYMIYCYKFFKETSLGWLWDSKISKEIAIYAGWTINGELAAIGNTQGLTILLNLYFGPVINAAHGIALQIQSAVNQFFSNFLTAVRPQITKSYAQKNMEYMHLLVLYSSRYSYFLVLFIAVPLLIHAEYILSIWIGNVPVHTVSLSRLMILLCVNRVLGTPVIMAIHATGDLKKFQLVEGTLLLTIIPINYLCLKYLHISPEMVFVIYFIVETITQFARVWIVFPRIDLSRRRYIYDILIPIIRLSVPLVIIVWMINQNWIIDGFFGFLTNCLLNIAIILLCIFIFGLNSTERNFVLNFIRRKGNQE